jgi:cytochrome P450
MGSRSNIVETYIQPGADRINALHEELEHGPPDPLSPACPVPAFYSSRHHAWVLSRYADVLAALREPLLSSRGAQGQDRSGMDDAKQIRSETLAALSAPRLVEWQAQMEGLAFSLIDDLPVDRMIDIVQELARPWSLGTALIVTGADPDDTGYLDNLARQASEAAADPSDLKLQRGANKANAELERYFQNAVIPMCGPAFVALSQTLPCFLANAWLALLRNPSEIESLFGRPGLMPEAVEELLRYAGLARKVSRQSRASVICGSVRIAEGESVILMLGSANRDPEHFADPNHLDLNRCAAGQVSFGAGSHSCVGGSLIRMAAAVLTSAIISKLANAEAKGPAEWRGGSGFRWVSRLDVLFNGDSHRNGITP